jgi:hypothetical protein
MSDLNIAIKDIVKKRDDYHRAEAYYGGENPEVFLNQRWFRMFYNERSTFRFNFSKTVVDAVLNRLEVEQVLAGSPQAEEYIDTIWEQTDLKLDMNEIHRNALVYGDCYAIVWPDSTGTMAIDYNSPLTTTMIYDQENPRVKSFAAKMWQTTSTENKKFLKVNLYYPDRIEKYMGDGDIDTLALNPNLQLVDVVPNPWGEIPVFHFRTHKPYGKPEHLDAYGPQDAINKLIATHMYSVDYQGAPQRYALSNGGNNSEMEDFADDDTARENLGSLQNGPGQLWYLQGVSAVGQFPAADPKTFTDPATTYINAMASITNTPNHYFLNGSHLPSGQALRVAEAPLFKKVLNRQLVLGSTWRDLFKFMFKVEGIPADVEIKWSNPESIDSLDNWDIAVRKKSVGVSLRQILLELGYDPEIADAVVSEAAGNPGEPLAPTSEVINAHNYALEQAAIERETVTANEQGSVPDVKP